MDTFLNLLTVLGAVAFVCGVAAIFGCLVAWAEWTWPGVTDRAGEQAFGEAWREK